MIRIILFLIFISTSAFAEFSPKIEEVTTDLGIKSYLITDKKYPIIATSIYFKTGYVNDEKEGLSNLVFSLLDEGAEDYKSKEFQDMLYAEGIEMSFDADEEILSVTMVCLKEKQEIAFNLLAMALNNPRFDDDAIARIKSQIAAVINMAEKNQGSIAIKNFKKSAYKDSGLKMTKTGTLESLKSITKADLKKYIKNNLAIDNMYIGVSGDIDGDILAKLLDKSFKNLSKTAVKSKLIKQKIDLDKKDIKIAYDSPQSVILFGQDGISRLDKDYYASMVLNYVLGGGGFSSRLVREIREKNSLVYGISTWLEMSDYSPRIMGYAGTSTENVPLAIDLIKKEWIKIKKDGITETELSDAKKYLLGSFPFKFSSSELISKVLASVMIQNLGKDYFNDYNKAIEDISVEDVKRVANYLFNDENILFITVGKK